MFKRCVALALVLGLIALGGCGQRSPQTIAVGGQDAGRTIELRTGDTLRVALEGNPSTGYQWLRVDQDTAVLKAVGEPAFSADRPMPGSPGTVTLVFAAAAPGEVTLELHYRRSFEPEAPPQGTYALTVRVSDPE